MAQPTVRHMSLYLNDKKVATINNISVTFDSGRTALYGSEGYLTHSKGAMMTRMDFTEVTPVGGSDLTALEKKFFNQEDVDVALIVGGTAKRLPMALKQFQFDSASESGACTGKGQLEGGRPVIT